MPKSFKKSATINACFMAVALAAVVLSGCQKASGPRLRNSDYFGALGGIRFADPDNLGPHSLGPNPKEKLGFVYTCKGGFIDMGHLREAADRAYYAAGTVYGTLMHLEKSCSFKIIEPSYYHLEIGYPVNWNLLSNQEKQTIARDISVQYGQYLGHLSLIWHEILTWYDYSSKGLFSENISSFSPEDTYSDVLGTCLGARALKNPRESYEETMTNLIDETLEELDVQPADVAKKAAKQVKGEWYEGAGYFFVRVKKRNFDVGFDDGFVTPWLLPDICPELISKDCPVPNPNAILTKHGFKMRLEMEMVGLEKGQVYKALHLKSSERIKPAIHFPKIIDSIIGEAQKREGPDVGNHILPSTAAEQDSKKNKGVSG
jgi:hypothetical protein